MKRTLLAALLGVSLLSGCATPCGVGQDIRMVVVRSAVNASTGVPIAQVRITSATLDGQNALEAGSGSAPGQGLLRSGLNGSVEKVRFENGQIVCDVQCSFGPPGAYVLTLEADGYQPQELRFTVASRRKGPAFGCGGTTTGTPRSFQLRFTPL